MTITQLQVKIDKASKCVLKTRKSKKEKLKYFRSLKIFFCWQKNLIEKNLIFLSTQMRAATLQHAESFFY